MESEYFTPCSQPRRSCLLLLLFWLLLLLLICILCTGNIMQLYSYFDSPLKCNLQILLRECRRIYDLTMAGKGEGSNNRLVIIYFVVRQVNSGLPFYIHGTRFRRIWGRCDTQKCTQRQICTRIYGFCSGVNLAHTEDLITYFLN